MFKVYFLFLLMVFMPFLSLAGMSSKVEEAKQAVFKIQGVSGVSGHGSGFFFGDQNTFVTAFHVVEGLLLYEIPEFASGPIVLGSLDLEEDIRMRQERQKREKTWQEKRQTILEERKQGIKAYRVVKGDESYKVRGIRALDARNDLAILDVEGYTGPVLNSVDHSVVHKSETYVLGFPGVYSDDFKIQKGKLNVRRSHSDYFTIINNTVKDLMGASGGPVVNAEGQVIGVLSMMIIDSNVVFATVLKYVFNLLHQNRLEHTSDLSDENKIAVAYARLGELVEDGGDIFAEWKYDQYQRSQIKTDFFGLDFPYQDFEMELALPHLQFRDIVYDEDGLPLEDKKARYKQLMSETYSSCQQFFRRLLR